MVVAGTFAAAIAWGAARGVIVARDGMSDPVAIADAIGAPGVVAQIVMTLLATGTAAIVLFAWRRPAAIAERMASRRAARRASTWAWAAAGGVSVFLASSLIAWLGGLVGVEPTASNAILADQGARETPLLLWAFAVLLAPAYEELLFRRVLFGRFWAAGRPWAGVVASSLAFALFHEVPGLSQNGWAAMCELWTVYVLMGATFAAVYRRTGTLWAAIAAHALNNAIALGFAMAGGQ